MQKAEDALQERVSSCTLPTLNFFFISTKKLKQHKRKYIYFFRSPGGAVFHPSGGGGVRQNIKIFVWKKLRLFCEKGPEKGHFYTIMQEKTVIFLVHKSSRKGSGLLGLPFSLVLGHLQRADGRCCRVARGPCWGWWPAWWCCWRIGWPQDSGCGKDLTDTT